MREDYTKSTGDTGEYEVAANFSRIGWGPVPNTRRDLGTDVFVQARDARRFDLGLFLGVQVKSGPSCFDKARTKTNARGEVLGWWHYEHGIEHLDDWVTHGLPHLLVLHNLDSRISYWAHVEARSVEIVGVGAKVFVPSGQRVDEANLPALIKVASTQRQGIPFEGSAWIASASVVPPARRLRHALVAPRLVAPHGNAGFDNPITPEEAIALLIQGRLRDLDQFSEKHQKVPDFNQAAVSRDWRWRFFAALYRATVANDSSGIDVCYADTKQHDRRAAATVALGCWLMEHERFDAAIELFERFGDRASPIDHAWILVQLARAQSEIGKLDEARQNAVLAIQSLSGGVDDVTASAIRAAASWQLYYTADFGSEDIAGVASASDTAVSWWRTQALSSGLATSLERTFRKAVHDTSRRFDFEDNANNRIYSATLTATFSGDQGAWAHSLRLLSYGTLSSGGQDVEGVASSLDNLRRVGDHSGLSLATEYVWAWGPTEAINCALQNVIGETWSHTSAYATLELIRTGGDLATQDQADMLLDRLFEIMRDRSSFVNRVNPTFVVDHTVLNAIAGLVGVGGSDRQKEIADYVSGLPKLEDNGLSSRALTRIVSRLDAETVGSQLATQLYQAALRQGQGSLAAALLRLASSSNADAHDEILSRVRSGDREALRVIADIRELSAEALQAAIEQDSTQVRRIMQEAEASTVSVWAHDAGHSLGVIGGWFPEAIEWDLLAAFLRHPLVAGQHKRNCCIALAHHAERLPGKVRDALSSIVLEISDGPLDVLLGEALGGAAVYLGVALGTFDESALAGRVADLLTSSTDKRADAASMIGHMDRPELVAISTGLVGDGDPRVRLAAATGLAVHVVRSGNASLALAVDCLKRIVRSPGAGMALRVVTPFYNATTGVSQVVSELVDELKAHQSALVRARANEIIVKSSAV